MSEETETTNKVLETKIDGLAKLTDERFSNLKDTLTRIENNALGFATKVELEDVKKDFNKTIELIRHDMLEHNKDDKNSFGDLAKQMGFLSKTIWLAMGGLGVIVFFLQIVLPYFITK